MRQQAPIEGNHNNACVEKNEWEKADLTVPKAMPGTSLSYHTALAGNNSAKSSTLRPRK